MKKILAQLGKMPMKPSTRALFREAEKIPGFSLRDFIHAYIYGRWPYLYIGIGTGTHPLTKVLEPLADIFIRALGHPAGDNPKQAWADSYHGKVMTLPAAKRLIEVEREIRLTDLERVIPYPKARDLILQQPERIVVLDCPCREYRPNPCLPLDVCLIMGEPFASFTREHHPDRSRWISKDEAAAILEAEYRRGHVHQAFFKDVILGRFYAICNCCSCCCGAINAHRNGTPMLTSSGYATRLTEELCTGCGICVAACHFGAVTSTGDAVSVDRRKCLGCGICVGNCPAEALALERDTALPEPLEIDELSRQGQA
jgi:ferredoxin